MDLNLQTVLAGLILAGILWILKSVSEQGKAIAVMRVVLMGADDKGGLVARVDALHAAQTDAFRDELRVSVADLKAAQEALAEERRHTKRREEDRAV